MKNIKNRLMAMALVLLLTGAAAPARLVERMAEAEAVEGRRALMVDEDGDFSESVHDALSRLGGTKLRFVAKSTVTSDAVVYTDERGTSAYAVRNGEWLEVHTPGRKFMLPEDASYLFADYDDSKFAELTAMDLSGFNTSKVEDMSGMFMACSSFTSLDLSNFDTSTVDDMGSMFLDCTSLDLSNFNNSKVMYMNDMFYNCSSLKTLDLSGFSSESHPSCHGMFLHTPKELQLKLSDAFRTYWDAFQAYLDAFGKRNDFFVPGALTGLSLEPFRILHEA